MKKLILAMLILCTLASIFLGWIGHKRILLQGLTYRLEAGACRHQGPGDELATWGMTILMTKEEHRFEDAPKQNWWRIAGLLQFMYGERRASVWLTLYRYHKGW